MNQLLVKIITLFGFVLSAFLAFNALQLSSCSSDDNGIEYVPSLDIGDTDSMSIDSLTVETEDSTSLSGDSLLTQFGHSLPVVKITIDEKYLWSEDSGLFVVGNNGAEYAGQIANYYQDWEFPSYLSYWENGEKIFIDTVGFRIKGRGSRAKPNKSIGLYWRGKYGKGKLKEQIFDNYPLEEFDRLRLRTGGSDGELTLIKDAFITRIMEGKTLFETASSKICVLYINEQYWGLYIIREMLNTHHFRNKYELDRDFIDILQGFPDYPGVDDGTADQFVNEVLPLFLYKDLSLDQNYEKVNELMDLDNMIDYFIAQTYIANVDWPGSNMKWWRSQNNTEFNKWKWVFFDVDFGFVLDRKEILWLGDYYQVGVENVPFPQIAPGYLLFDALMKNKTFEIKFLERYLYFIEDVFDPTRVEDILQEMIDEIGTEWIKHEETWPYYKYYDIWILILNDMLVFNEERNQWIKPHIEELLETAREE